MSEFDAREKNEEKRDETVRCTKLSICRSMQCKFCTFFILTTSLRNTFPQCFQVFVIFLPDGGRCAYSFASTEEVKKRKCFHPLFLLLKFWRFVILLIRIFTVYSDYLIQVSTIASHCLSLVNRSCNGIKNIWIPGEKLDIRGPKTRLKFSVNSKSFLLFKWIFNFLIQFSRLLIPS